jgi:hypothetical protein
MRGASVSVCVGTLTDWLGIASFHLRKLSDGSVRFASKF